MKNVNKLIMLIFAALSLMPQTTFSMEQSTGQTQNADQIVYHSNDLRTINGQRQRRVARPRTLADGTVTIDYQWVNYNRIPEPCPSIKHQSYFYGSHGSEEEKFNR